MEQATRPEILPQEVLRPKEQPRRAELFAVPFETIGQNSIRVAEASNRTQSFAAPQERIADLNPRSVRSEDVKAKRAARGAALAAEAMVLDVVDTEVGWWTPALRTGTSFLTAPFIMGRYAQARAYIKESQPEVATTLRAPFWGLAAYLYQVSNGFLQYLSGGNTYFVARLLS